LEALQRGKQYMRAVQLYYRKFHRYPPSVDALENTESIRFLRKRYIDPITGKDDWQPIQFGQNKVPMMGLFGQPIVSLQMPGVGAGTNGSLSSSPASGASNSSSGNPAESDSSAQNPTNGQTFGGSGIIGFSIPSDKVAILHYKKQDHYSLWEFVYDPSQELGVGMAPAGPTNANGSNPQGPPSLNPPAPGGPGPGNIQPPCGGQFGPDGNLPSPCPK
jgi:hypothetical protein